MFQTCLQREPRAVSPEQRPQGSASSPSASKSPHSPTHKTAASHAAGSPAGTQSFTPRRSSRLDRVAAVAPPDSSPLLAAAVQPKGNCNRGQHTPPKSLVPKRVGHQSKSADDAHADPSSASRGSLHASEEDEQSHSQKTPGSLAASMYEAGASQGGVSQRPAGSLAASDHDSQLQSQGTDGGGASHAQLPSSMDAAVALPKRQRVTRQNAHAALAEDQGHEKEDEEGDEHMHAVKEAGTSLGMESIPQELNHETNLSLGMGSMPEQLEQDEEMHEKDASDGEGRESEVVDAEEEEEEEDDAEQVDEEMAEEDSGEDSEPEETTLRPVRRCR
jgi:hypothetical protein